MSFNLIDKPACKMRFHKRPIAAITFGVPLLFLFWVFIIKSPSSVNNNETHQQLPPNFSTTKESKKNQMVIDELSAPESLAYKKKKDDNILDHQPIRNKNYNAQRNDLIPQSSHIKPTKVDPKLGGIVDKSVRLPVIFGGLKQLNMAPQYELEGMIETYGVNGSPVELSGEDQRLAEEIIRKEAFNVFISDRISLHRNVPDTRDSACRKLSYDTRLPNASVVIIFTNEAYSTLLRTVWSVLDKSKAHPNSVHEIILGKPICLVYM